MIVKFQLIDAMNLFFATKHVVRGDADQKGAMAVHIAIQSMAKAWRMFNIDHVVMALESKNNWRYDHLKNYKGQRRLKQLERTARDIEDDEIFFSYLDGFVKFVADRTNITVLQASRCEADDMIARWVQLHPDDKHVIVSNDTDFYQLLAPNVTIYRPQQKQIIDTTSIIDSETDKTIIDGKTKKPKLPPEPKWELFKKICRGDSTDNIFPATAPRTRETKIRSAYEDQNNKGFDFNNLMLTEFDDPMSGESVKTINRFSENERLIDLTKQPQEIRDTAAKSIIQSVAKEEIPNAKIGHSFMRFCSEYDLKRLSDNFATITPMFTARYGDKNAN